MKNLAFILAFVFAHSVSHAAPHHAVHPVIFKNGIANIKGQIKGYEFVDYRFAANAGQSLRAHLKTNNRSNYFNLLAPGENEIAFFNGSVSDNTYSGETSVDGEYTARVYLIRNAARRGGKASYRLTITREEDR